MSDSPQSPACITMLNANDVLLGRGDLAVRYEGNVRFRQLVREKSQHYMDACGSLAKDKIAFGIMRIVAERNGRFLRKVKSSVESNQSGVPSGEGAWVPVDSSISLRKVKQAFRDNDSWTQAPSLSMLQDHHPATNLQSPSAQRPTEPTGG